jgi:hypothetical protein
VRLDKGRVVTIADRYDGDKQAKLSLMLAMEPTMEDKSVVLPGLATILLEGAEAPTVEAIPITDARLRRAWPDKLYRVLIPFAGSELRLTIE